MHKFQGLHREAYLSPSVWSLPQSSTRWRFSSVHLCSVCLARRSCAAEQQKKNVQQGSCCPSAPASNPQVRVKKMIWKKSRFHTNKYLLYRILKIFAHRCKFLHFSLLGLIQVRGFGHNVNSCGHLVIALSQGPGFSSAILFISLIFFRRGRWKSHFLYELRISILSCSHWGCICEYQKQKNNTARSHIMSQCCTFKVSPRCTCKSLKKKKKKNGPTNLAFMYLFCAGDTKVTQI